ncbi:MAG: HK97 family phage prohead protease, partial [Alphaproteobacteria bacterium]
STESAAAARLTVPFATTSPDAAGIIEGYASVFRRPDDGRDIVLPGAFRRTLARRGPRAVKLLWQHDPKEPIGVIEELKEDARGLYVRARLLPELERAREALALIRAGALDGLSIGYRTVKSRPDPETGLRLISEVDLWEVSLVTFPMQPAARIRALKAWRPHQALRRFEAFLREAGGFSRSEAKAIANHGLAALGGRDAARSRAGQGEWDALRQALLALLDSLAAMERTKE